MYCTRHYCACLRRWCFSVSIFFAIFLARLIVSMFQANIHKILLFLFFSFAGSYRRRRSRVHFSIKIPKLIVVFIEQISVFPLRRYRTARNIQYYFRVDGIQCSLMYSMKWVSSKWIEFWLPAISRKEKWKTRRFHSRRWVSNLAEDITWATSSGGWGSSTIMHINNIMVIPNVYKAHTHCLLAYHCCCS